MLRYRFPALIGALALVLYGVALQPAVAGVVCESYIESGTCESWLDIDNPKHEFSPSGGGGKARVCVRGGIVIECVSGDGVWSEMNCYLKLDPDQTTPVGSVHEGRTDGHWYTCRGPGLNLRTYIATYERPDPADLARRAMARMELSAVRVGIVPTPTEVDADAVGLVGRAVWMWAESPDQTTWGPKTLTLSEGPFSVTVAAKVEKVEWLMGDGNTVVCDSPGTEWTPLGARENRSSPDCGYRYDKQGTYTITARSQWVADWAGMGQSGQLRLALQRSARIVVGEAQVVTVGTR